MILHLTPAIGVATDTTTRRQYDRVTTGKAITRLSSPSAGIQDGHKTELETVRDSCSTHAEDFVLGHVGDHVCICRRYCQFDAESLVLTWHSAEGAKALGEFPLDPLRLQGKITNEHSKPFEFKVRDDSTHNCHGCGAAC
jgi:hypothetical protein